LQGETEELGKYARERISKLEREMEDFKRPYSDAV
jgi:hypothetical protein